MRYRQKALTIQLQGKAPNTFAFGARVTVVTRTLHMMNEIRSGGSYLSQSDLRLRFGLGDADNADKIVIRWPDGREDTLTDVAGGALVVIAYGGKILRSENYHALPTRLQKD